MKGLIDEKGALGLKRGDVYIEQFCPEQSQLLEHKGFACGKWCPQFGEPRHMENTTILAQQAGIKTDNVYEIQLDICQGKTLIFKPEDFEDRRK